MEHPVQMKQKVIPAPAFAVVNLSPRKRGAGIQPFYNRFLDSCLSRSDNMLVPLLIQTSIIIADYLERAIAPAQRWAGTLPPNR